MASISTNSRDDIVIAVMGAVGSAKSTLISKLVDSRVAIGDGSHACTTNIELYDSFLSSDRRIRLLDTPGFDNTHISDVQILYKISEYLSKTYQNGLQLSGIVYLHPITDARLNGFIGNNLAMFKSLCGDAFYPKVVLASTRWNSLSSNDIGIRREAEILRGEWGLMCQRGSKVFRLENSGQSALNIIEYLIDLQVKDRRSVEQELAEEQEVQILRQISQELSDNLCDTMERFEKEFANLRTEMEEVVKSKDAERARVLGAQQDRLRTRLEQSQRSRHTLFVGLERLRLETEERHNRLLREMSPVAESVSTPSTGSQSRAQRIIDREKVEKLLSYLERSSPPVPEPKKQQPSTSVILHRRGTGIREELTPKIKRTDTANTQQSNVESVRLGKRQDLVLPDKKDQNANVQRPTSSPGIQSQAFKLASYEPSVSSEAISTSSGLQSATPKSSRDYLHLLSPDNREYWSRILNQDSKPNAVTTVKLSRSPDYRARVSDTEEDYNAARQTNQENRVYPPDTSEPVPDSNADKGPTPPAHRALSPGSQSDASILSYMNPDRRAYWSRVLGPDPDYASTKDSISELALSPISDQRTESSFYPFQKLDGGSPERFSPNRRLPNPPSPARRLTYQDELMSLSSSRPSFDKNNPTPPNRSHDYSQGFRDTGYKFQQNIADPFARNLPLDDEHGLDWSKLSLTETDGAQSPSRSEGVSIVGPTYSEVETEQGRSYGRDSPSKGKDRDYGFGTSRWDEPIGY